MPNIARNQHQFRFLLASIDCSPYEIGPKSSQLKLEFSKNTIKIPPLKNRTDSVEFSNTYQDSSNPFVFTPILTAAASLISNFQ